MVRRSLLGVASLLSLAGAVAIHGCIGVGDGDSAPPNAPRQEARPEREIGQVGLELRLPDGSDVSEVFYTITRTGMMPRSGSIPVTADGHVRMQLGDLSAFTGYTLSLSAVRGALPPCAGAATFAIGGGQTTNISVFLQCGTLGRGGNLAIDGSFNYCPSAPTIVAAPTSVTVGQSVTLSATARDEDPVTFAWSAPSGTFSAATQANTTFLCTSAATVTVTVAVSDSRGCNGVTSTVDITCAGVAPSPIFSSQPAYIIPVATGVTTKAILTTGDSPNNKPGGTTPYRMVGLPDGLGAFDNNDGTFTLLSNHELGNTSGSARAHGGTGAFVSRWTVRKSDLGVLHGDDLMQTVKLWNPATSAYVARPDVAFGRFCSADLPRTSALYNAVTSNGFNGRLFFNGEETGNEGRALAHGMDGVTYELPRLGKASWENIVASPFAQDKTIVLGLDDSTPGQLYVYVGTKTKTGSPIERAGLTNGALYGVVVAGNPSEPAAGIATAAFSLFSLGNVENTTGATLETNSSAANVTRFNRPEDGAWDPAHPRDFYFVTTNAISAPSRLWRLRFNNIAQPELGGTLDMLLDGTEGQIMLDNIGIDGRGHILLEEDPGNNARLAQIFRYTIASDSLVAIVQHNPPLFTTGGAGFITQDEEGSGVIDATALLGAGWWLTSDQIHLAVGGELVEGGQYTAIYDPGTL